jgi:hypothetical protein
MLAVPGHVAGYLRGQADALERYCACDAPADRAREEIVSARAGRLAAYACESVVSSQLSVSDQHRWG